MEKQLAKDIPKSGGFTLADIVSPSVAHNTIFSSTPCELFSRVVQTVTRHSYTGEYYRAVDCTTLSPPPSLHSSYSFSYDSAEPRLALVVGSCCGIPMLIQKREFLGLRARLNLRRHSDQRKLQSVIVCVQHTRT